MHASQSHNHTVYVGSYVPTYTIYYVGNVGTVWPDLAKYYHFVEILNLWPFFEGLFRIKQNVLPSLANFK